MNLSNLITEKELGSVATMHLLMIIFIIIASSIACPVELISIKMFESHIQMINISFQQVFKL